MARSGCLTCVKCTLFVFNFIFWLVGCLLLAIGIWSLVDPGAVRDYATNREWEASILIYTIITVGSIMTIIGFLGCCGAIRGSRCLLALFFMLHIFMNAMVLFAVSTFQFFIMLFIIHGIFLSVGLFMVIKRDKAKDWFPQPQKETTTKRLRELVSNFDLDMIGRKHMEELQFEHKCCGADKGAQDYIELLPDSTGPPCREKIRMRACVGPVFRDEVARYKDLMEELPKYYIITSAVILTICFLMIIAMILSIVLCCALKDELTSTY